MFSSQETSQRYRHSETVPQVQPEAEEVDSEAPQQVQGQRAASGRQHAQNGEIRLEEPLRSNSD